MHASKHILADRPVLSHIRQRLVEGQAFSFHQVGTDAAHAAADLIHISCIGILHVRARARARANKTSITAPPRPTVHQPPATLPGLGDEIRRLLEELTQVFARQFAQKREKESVHSLRTRLCAVVQERMVYSIRA